MPLAALIFFAALHPANAQSVRGRVVDATDRPVFGVVVLLIDSASSTAARALTSQAGEFRLAAPRPGTYRVRTLRIGFRPVVSDTFALIGAADVTKKIVITGVALGLDTMRVAGTNSCRGLGDSTGATFALWEQVRAAFIAAEITAAARSIMATTVTYDRSIDPHSGSGLGRVVRQQATVSKSVVTHAWRSLAPDSLRRVGYVVTARDNSVTYYAPGLDMLLSPLFVEDHCFHLVTDSRRRSLIGISFEPTPERRHVRVGDINGTVWIDRPTSELRELEFHYVGVPAEQAENAGGGMTFERMRDGTWTISRWDIRMPVFEQVVVPGHGTDLRFRELRVNGGFVSLATRGADTLWAGPRAQLQGTVLDSASGHGVANAFLVFDGAGVSAQTDARGKFSVSEMLPGQYTLQVHTPSLDSMNTVHRTSLTILDSIADVELRVPNGSQLAKTLCPKNADAGMVIGALRFASQTPAVRNGKVIAEWQSDPKDSTHLRRLELPATSSGEIRVCGLPFDTPIQLQGSADGAESAEPIVVQVSPAVRLERVNVQLETEAELDKRGATFTGVVMSDTSHAAVIGAEVSFPELGKTTLTDARGAFKISGIPAGEQHLSVRRLGYGAADTKLTFTGHERLERRVVLGKAVTLAPVQIVDKFTERWLREFDENRRLGLGHFLTREDLEKFTGAQFATALSQLPGVQIAYGRAHNYPHSRRSVESVCPRPLLYNKPCFDKWGFYSGGGDGVAAPGIEGDPPPVACYSLVWIDGVLQNGTHYPTEPFDLNELHPESIEAVEYYYGLAQIPMRYQRPGADCGVVVVWLRR